MPSPLTRKELIKALADPKDRELEIGRAILSLRSTGDLPPDRPSLLSLLRETSALDYSYVLKWARATAFVDSTNPARAEWGISRLLEILSIESPADREKFLATIAPSTLTVRRLRDEVRKFLGHLPGPDLPTAPHEVSAEAVRIALQRTGIEKSQVGLQVQAGRKSDPSGSVVVNCNVVTPVSAKALAVAGEVLAEIAAVREVWRWKSTGSADPEHWALPLEELDRLQPGPVEVEWAAPDLIHVSRGGSLIAKLPVQRKTIASIAHPKGNQKTAGVCGIINSVHLGCLRRATGFPKCQLPCYAAEDGSGGCFSNVAQHPPDEGSDHPSPNIIYNGLVNNGLKIVLPVTGVASLKRYRVHASGNEPMVWRVDAESADGAMGIALGNLQMWAEANPEVRFLTICSHAAAPSDAMLCWLAALRNVWVGTSVSAWFHPIELEHRFAAAQRLLDFGIPSVIWISTAPDWDNQPVLKRALKLVPPECIVEYPLWGIHRHDLPVLHVNPLGACGDHRVDRGGHRWVVEQTGGSGAGGVRLRPENHDYDDPRHPLKSRCLGCQLRCGLPGVVSRLRPA